MAQRPGFLPNLTSSFKRLRGQPAIETQKFSDACTAILPIFDHLGPVFHFAKHELDTKRQSLERVSGTLTTLSAVVDADIKAGRVTVKDSCARNLHRLLTSIAFIAALLRNLAADRNTSLRVAASDAYAATLAPVHTFFVRTAVKSTMYLLPARADFLASIGETEETAAEHSKAFAPAVDDLVSDVLRLYGNIEMPRSASTSIG